MFWQLEKRRKRLKVKLEMAKFLQDTIEETALQRKDGSGEGETVKEFVQFMDQVHKFWLFIQSSFSTGVILFTDCNLCCQCPLAENTSDGWA